MSDWNSFEEASDHVDWDYRDDDGPDYEDVPDYGDVPAADYDDVIECADYDPLCDYSTEHGDEDFVDPSMDIPPAFDNDHMNDENFDEDEDFVEDADFADDDFDDDDFDDDDFDDDDFDDVKEDDSCDDMDSVLLQQTEDAPFEVLQWPFQADERLPYGFVTVVVTTSKEALTDYVRGDERVIRIAASESLTVSDLENVIQKRKGWVGTMLYATDDSLRSWKQIPVKVATLAKLMCSITRFFGTINFFLQKTRVDKRQVHFICPVLPECPFISEGEQCEAYNDLLKYDFSGAAQMHMKTYSHASIPLVACRYGVQCTAYQRIHGGEKEVKDCCHVQVYSHQCCAAQTPFDEVSPYKLGSLSRDSEHGIEGVEHANSFADTLEKLATRHINAVGPLLALTNEVVSNEYGYVMTLPNSGGPLLAIVDEKLKHERHLAMGSPLKKCHMLALLLYTGCDCIGDLTDSQMEGDYLKWAVWDKLLREALKRLEKVNVRLAPAYSGVNDVELKGNVRFGVFRTFVSASLDRNKAMDFKDACGMLLGFEVSRVRPGASELQPTDTRGVDVSWISKFPKEKEILFSRESGYFAMKQESKTTRTQRVRVAFCGDFSDTRLF